MDELPRAVRQAAPRALLYVAGACSLASVIAMLAIDRPVAAAVAPYQPWPIWAAVLHVLDVISLYTLHPGALYVALGAAVVATVAVPRWRAVAHAWAFAAGTIGVTMLLTGHLKDWTQRVRPANYKGTADTFFLGGSSFPSGDVTKYAGLAIIVAVLFPRHRAWLAGVIAFVCVARIALERHWVSDTLAGVALPALVAYGVALATRPISPR